MIDCGSVLEVDFCSVIFWVGYFFLKEYNKFCGYYYVVIDVCEILCIGVLKDENDGL